MFAVLALMQMVRIPIVEEDNIRRADDLLWLVLLWWRWVIARFSIHLFGSELNGFILRVGSFYREVLFLNIVRNCGIYNLIRLVIRTGI